MPTVFRKDGFRFFFFSNEGNEPIHVHVESGDGYAKFWLLPSVKLAESARYNDKILNKLGKLIEENKEMLIKATQVWFDKAMLFLRLEDGREVGVPLGWFPTLNGATTKQLNNWRLIEGGAGIHWEDLDEDISVKALLS